MERLVTQYRETTPVNPKRHADGWVRERREVYDLGGQVHYTAWQPDAAARS